MNCLILATPVHPSLCLQYLLLLFTTVTITAVILLLLLLFHYYHQYKTIATDKPLRARLFPGAAELITHLLRLTYILWLPLCRINKFGFLPSKIVAIPYTCGSSTLLMRCFKCLFICSTGGFWSDRRTRTYWTWRRMRSGGFMRGLEPDAWRLLHDFGFPIFVLS
jgi:hypothetical protein